MKKIYIRAFTPKGLECLEKAKELVFSSKKFLKEFKVNIENDLIILECINKAVLNAEKMGADLSGMITNKATHLINTDFEKWGGKAGEDYRVYTE